MTNIRTVKQINKSRPTLEGAGVHLKRAFGFSAPAMFDPFLLLDDFRSINPPEYLKGFPWHPHRGIETITYILEGKIEHGDSLGNKGLIGPGDVQWMTAGNGVIHQEMPKGDSVGHMGGFQLWANLPAKDKMMNPRYRDVKSSQIPILTLPNGVEIRIICGKVDGTQGPVQDIMIDPEYLDVTVPPHESFSHPTQPGHTVIVYVISGSGKFEPEKDAFYSNGDLLLFNDGDQFSASAQTSGVRFLYFSGKPIKEPIAWYGPIVMNTNEELQIAFEEYQNGTFLKYQQPDQNKKGYEPNSKLPYTE